MNPHFRGYANNTGERRLYYISLGLFSTALYGIPVALASGFVIDSFQSTALALVAGLGVWTFLGVFSMRWAHRSYLKSLTYDQSSESAEDFSKELRTGLLLYAGLSSLLMLVIAGAPALIGLPTFYSLLVPTGVAYFSCVILFACTTLYSLFGLIEKIRDNVYPEHPGFTAVLIFMLAMISFVISSITGV